MSGSDIWSMLKKTFSEYGADRVPRLSAALAYYTVFSLAPLLVIGVVILSMFMDSQAASDGIEQQLTSMLGSSAGDALHQMLKNGTEQSGSGVWATILSVIILLFGASGVFGELQDSLNTIFDVRAKPGQGWLATIRKRLLSMGMVFVVLFLLVVSLVVTTVITSFSERLAGGSQFIAHVLDIVVGTAVIAGLFACIFKVLPDVKIEWHDVIFGAVVTAVLFTIGRIGLSYYLSHGSTASAYGAAGSLAALLVWIYYSAQIVFIGAEFTQVYANQMGSGIEPEDDAEPVPGEDPDSTGLPSREGDEDGEKRSSSTRRKSKGHRAGHRAGDRRREPALSAVLREADAPESRNPLGRTPWGPRATTGPRSGHRQTVAQLYVPEEPSRAPSADKLSSLSLGAVLGGLAAVAGLIIKRKIADEHLAADRVDQRLARIETRLGPPERIHRLAAEADARARLREIEERVLNTAKVAGQSERIGLKERLAEIIAGR